MDSEVFGALDFPQLARRIPALPGDSVFQSARRHGVRIVGACGGRGTCGTCIVRVADGDVVPMEGASVDTGKRWLRACRVRPVGAVTIEIAPRSLAPVARAEIDTGADDERLPFDPAVAGVDVVVPAPTAEHPTADAERLAAALGRADLQLDLDVLRELPLRLRDGGRALRVRLRGAEAIGLAETGRHTFGLAVDLGTTNAAGFLIDLDTGVRIAGLGIENPQVAWGGDIVSRLNHAARGAAQAGELREAACTAINALAHDLTHAVGASPADIADIVIGGNTVMHHLLLGLPVAQLGRAPFVAAVRGALEAKARELGLSAARGAWAHLVPAIGGFIGGDHVSALLACEERWRSGRTCVVMDIGTNTEISLIHDGVIRSASAPSGPALEGGHIACGMRAADGAIERVSLDAAGRLVVATIGDEEPVGLCGSGVLDAIATLHRAGALHDSGRLIEAHPAIVPHGGGCAARLAPSVVLTQADVRAVQLAKAAIRTALDLLLDDAGLGHDAVEELIIAGSFGAYIDVASAVAIGLLPPLPRERMRQVGNAAGLGVRMLAASAAARRRAAEIAGTARCIELSGRGSFQRTFVANIRLPGHALPC